MPIQSSNSARYTLIDAALELVWLTRCCGCEKPGALLCDACKQAFKWIEHQSACTSCGAPFGHLVCTECYSGEGKQSHSFDAAVCSVDLDELSGRVIVLYKDHNEHRLSRVLACELLAAALPAEWLTWADVITWVPADKKALRRRGFDHMERIALDLAKQTHLPAERLLSKQTGKDQRGLNRSQRLINLKNNITLYKTKSPLPPHILVIDDVFTTGSTFAAASERLREGGASEVRVASIARAW